MTSNAYIIVLWTSAHVQDSSVQFSKLCLSPVRTAKQKSHDMPPIFLWECQCDIWFNWFEIEACSV